ncbi:MBOAT family O-acyltransferase [Vampirovibrio chlorellavorus]|uniref:MBOAT family O-acyltransferase n=1 Tax=Vampirovibrio chlorellavorus TaxID=758823 RepID=UPI0026EB7546|nr:MBOAT family O-acyltransferase [Vampirovibrio chlorellavorus]
MLFNSLTYILFLALVALLYWNVPPRFRVPLLLLASYGFYMSWSPPHGLIYGPLILVDSLYFYGLSVAMVRWPDFKKSLLIFGVTTELLLLAYFKYANFLAQTSEQILRWLHLPAAHQQFDIFLPLAISFTNFVLISYLIDVYRGKETPDPSFVRFATYVAFFPHLIAGPIVRASELLRQFDDNPRFDKARLIQGIHRFCTGFFLKVFIADVIAVYVDTIFGHPGLQAFNTNWIALYGFSVQLFCDFFGYTLMAQGSALILGYTLPENFNAPYFAKNMSEFWQRWHISLSRWLRDYLYIPLGGNRHGKVNTYRNLFITMGLGGLWHGASWNFVIWGLLNGLFLCIYKTAAYFKINRFIPTALAVIITFHAVCLTRVFFRAPTLQEAWHFLGALLNPFHWQTLATPAGSVEDGHAFMAPETALLLVILFFVGHALIRYYRPRLTHPLWQEASIAAAYGIFLYGLITLGGRSSQQFIYFQF